MDILKPDGRQLALGDLDGNGKIEVPDVITMLQGLAGVIDLPTQCGPTNES